MTERKGASMHIKIGRRIVHPDAIRYAEVVEKGERYSSAGSEPVRERTVYLHIDRGGGSAIGAYLAGEEADLFLEALPVYDPALDNLDAFPDDEEPPD